MMDRKREYTKGLWWSKVALFIVVMMMAMSCRKSNNENADQLEQFLQRNESGLWGYGGYLFKYSAQNCQFAINVNRRQIRMQEDSQQDYINLQFAVFPPTAEDEVELLLTYKVGNEENSRNCVMTTVRSEGNKIWLWDYQNNMGIIIPSGWALE